MPCKNCIAYEETYSFLCISKRIKIISSYSHSYLTSGFTLITACRQRYQPSYFAATSLMLFCITRPPEDTGLFATKSPLTTTFLSLTMDYLLSRLSITLPYLYNWLAAAGLTEVLLRKSFSYNWNLTWLHYQYQFWQFEKRTLRKFENCYRNMFKISWKMFSFLILANMEVGANLPKYIFCKFSM